MNNERLQRRLYDYVSADGGDQTAAYETAVRSPYLTALVRRYFPEDPDARIIDLGCGSGLLMATAAKLGYRRLSGVEQATHRATVARLRGGNVTEGDLMAYVTALPAESCDFIIAFDVLEHFGGDDLLDLTDAVRTALRPGGRWLIHVPNATSPFFGAVFHGDLTHCVAFTPESLGLLLRASGFRAVRHYEDEPAVYGARSLIRRAAWRGLRMLLRFWNAVETGDTGREAVLTRSLLTIAEK